MKYAILAFAVLLSGCGSTKTFENIAACSLDRKELMFISMYNSVGIAAKVRESDAQAVCAPAGAASAAK